MQKCKHAAPIVDWRSKLELERKVIGSNKLAKELLLKGFKLVDISPHRNDGKRTVFVFEYTDDLKVYLLNREV